MLDWVNSLLKQLLSKPGTAQNLLQELEVIRVKVNDFYMPSKVDWNLSLDVSNAFLEQAGWMNISSLA